MAGLLDQFFGNADQTAALGLLGAGMMRGNFAGGAMAAQGLLADAPKRKMEQELAQMKMENMRGEIEQRKQAATLAQQRQAQQDAFLNGGGLGAGAIGGQGSAGGGLGVGAMGGGGVIEKARAMGIPEEAIKADVLFNGGKKISELLAKHGARDMQVSNGFAYDKNQLGAGFMPFLNTSNTGQTSMGRIGPDGLPVVSAPQGALETFGAYQRAGEQTKADFDPMIIPPRAGQQHPTQTTRGAFVSGQQGPANAGEAGMARQVAGPMGADPEAIEREIQKTVQDLTSKPLDPASRKLLEAHVSDLSAQLRSLSVAPPVQTAGIALQSEPEKIRAAEQAKADVVPTAKRQAALATATNSIAVLDKALSHPGLPEATGLQGKIDPRNYIPGTDATNFNVMMDQIKGKAFLQAFESLKGGGQITEVEGKKATEAIARLNQAQSTPEFKAALNELRDVLIGAKALAMGGGGVAAPEGSWEPSGKGSAVSSGGWSATLKK